MTVTSANAVTTLSSSIQSILTQIIITSLTDNLVDNSSLIEMYLLTLILKKATVLIDSTMLRLPGFIDSSISKNAVFQIFRSICDNILRSLTRSVAIRLTGN